MYFGKTQCTLIEKVRFVLSSGVLHVHVHVYMYMYGGGGEGRGAKGHILLLQVCASPFVEFGSQVKHTPVISPDFSRLQDFLPNLPLPQQFLEGEVACIVSTPLVSCSWGCGESVNSSKLNIQEVQETLTSRPTFKRETQAHYPFFMIFFYFCQITHLHTF